MNNHAPTVLTRGSGTLTSGNAEGKRRFCLAIRFIDRIVRRRLGAPVLVALGRESHSESHSVTSPHGAAPAAPDSPTWKRDRP
ncbi:MAG: hypothetical protein LBE08_07015 [Bifidobacteriaceae bacterium]|nr:hypothetical protein [Bifidobacteriaceae bacterium]